MVQHEAGEQQPEAERAESDGFDRARVRSAQQLTGQCAQEGGRDRGQRGEYALGVEARGGGARPGVAREYMRIHPPRQAAGRLELARAITRHRNEREHRPVTGEQSGDPRHLPAPAGPQENRARREITHGDALEHTGYTDGPEGKMVRRQESEGKSGQQHAEREDDRGSPPDMRHELPAVRAFLHAPRAGKRHRDSDDPQEAGEHEVGGGPAMPGRVPERWIDVAPRTRIVHEQHAGDRRPAEGVEGNEAGGRVHNGRRGLLDGEI